MSANNAYQNSGMRIQNMPDGRFMTAYSRGKYAYAQASTYYPTGGNQDASASAMDAEHGEYVRPQMLGPSNKSWDLTRHKFSFNVMFDTTSKGPIDVVIQEQDLREIFRENAAFDPDLCNKSLQKAVVVKTEIVGTTLAPNAKYGLKLYDGSSPPKPMFRMHGYKNSRDNVFRQKGFPMYGKSMILMSSPEKIDRDLSLYGGITLEDITRNTVELKYPACNGQPEQSMMLVPKENGAYFVWALEVVNSEVQNLLTDPVFQDPNNIDYIRLPRQLYDNVVKAYSTKISEDVNFYDLRTVRATLTHLGSDDSAPHRSGYTANGEAPVFENILIEMTAFMPDLPVGYEARGTYRGGSKKTNVVDSYEGQDYKDVLHQFGECPPPSISRPYDGGMYRARQ